MVRVMIADDHAMVREGLHWALEHAGYDVVGEAADGEEAVEMAEQLRPDIVLMDLSLPVLSGVAATKRIRSRVQNTKVVALSMLSDESAVSSALAAGAVGYLVKDSTTAEIIEALGEVVEAAPGARVLSPSATPVSPPEGLGVAPVPAPSSGDQALISKREEEVLRLVATGASISEVGRRLYISSKTVKNHLSSIYQKLDCHDRAQAVLKAVRMGLIRLD
ncbi:MAG TPA: response regulator transcription factor [Acidimicrobiales bacterium]|nr:response regulator transcription factor [Acidimicrobiales bacterium]